MGVGEGLFSGLTAHQQVDKMRVISTVLVLVVLGVQADKDWKIFMNWAKTKAMESCWGEENMKLHTLNMKKAVAKCMDEDAPELDLPPFRVMDRLVNNLVSSSDENEDMMKMMKLCMNQDTKKKIETNFGPVEDLLEDFNNQVNEEQLFYMVNQLLQGSEEDFM